jgi:nucleoside phosphorylase
MAILSEPPTTRDSFQIAVICALPEERDAVEKAMTRDYKGEGHVYGRAQGDDNHYTTGELGRKPVVLATPSNTGTVNISHLAVNMRQSFPNLGCAFVVGIAGGAPFKYDKQTDTWSDSDIFLGDVVVSTQVVEYDFGAALDDSFIRKTAVEDVLPRAPTLITTFLNVLKTGKSNAFERVLQKTNADLGDWGSEYERPMPETDRVYASTYRRKHRDQAMCMAYRQYAEWYDKVCDRALDTDCSSLGCIPSRTNESQNTKIHFGRVASGNAVMASAHRRDKIIQEEGCIAFETAGAATWDVLGTIVVKGVVDYADSHKNSIWRAYAAARAALCAKALIEEIELPDVPQSRHTGQ